MAGTGRLVWVEGKLNGAKYSDSLNGNLVQSDWDLRLNQRFPFQQDYDPQDTAKTMQEWLRDNSRMSLHGPARALS